MIFLFKNAELTANFASIDGSVAWGGLHRPVFLAFVQRLDNCTEVVDIVTAQVYHVVDV